MNHTGLTAWAAVALLVAAAGCSSAGGVVPDSAGAASVQGGADPARDDGEAALVEADRETRKLVVLRDGTEDPYMKEVIEHELHAIRGHKASLEDVLSVGAGPDPAIRRYTANLRRAMGAGFATEMQAWTLVQQGAPPAAP
jgi:hypothetical protein